MDKLQYIYKNLLAKKEKRDKFKIVCKGNYASNGKNLN